MTAEGCACLIRRRIRVFVFARAKRGNAGTKIRDQNFEDSEKALESEFGLFPTTANIGGYLYHGDQWPPTR